MSLPPLYEFQSRGFALVRAEVARLQSQGIPKPGVFVVAPTGAGKTRIGLEFAARARARGKRTLWYVPRGELARQPYEKIRAYGWEDVRILRSKAHGGDEGPVDASIIISTVQTIIARPDALPDASEFDLGIGDEGRHYAADAWGRVPAALRGVVRVFLDATPARSDGRGLDVIADGMVEIATVAELTALGYLTPLTVFAPPDVPGGRKHLARRPVDAWLAKTPGQRCIVYAPSVAAAEAFATEFIAAGVSCEVVSGKSTRAQREGAIQRLASGETLVVCNCMLYVEGLDVREVSSVIIARKVGHVSMWQQMGGRALRTCPEIGKTHAYILDLLGNYHRPDFGPLDRARVWTLDGRSGRPVAALPPAVMCRVCHAWGPGGGRCTAPTCGADLPPAPLPRVRAADLVEMRCARDSEAVRRTRLETFVDQAISAKRNPWSAAHRYRGTYGESPPVEWIREAVRKMKGAAA